MDKIDAGANPEPDRPSLAGEAAGDPVDVWGAVRASLGGRPSHAAARPARPSRGARASCCLAWLATSLYRVQPDEKGVVLRFGQWVATTEPGLHAHLPFPIETVLLPKVTQINQIQIGVGPSAARGGRLNPTAAGRC